MVTPRPDLATFFLGTALATLAACAPPTPAPAPAAPPPAQSARQETPAPAVCPAAAPELADDADTEDKPFDLKIEQICVYGVSDETRAAANQAITLQIGQSLSQEATRASLEGLAQTSLFEDARLGAEAHGKSVIVHVVLRERLQIEEVVYEPAGAKESVGPIDLGKRADPHALRGMAERMESDLQQKGYGNAKVAMTLEPTKAGFARVHVKIDKGPAWTIAKLSFPGAKKVRDPELQSASALTLGNPWSAEAIRAATLKLTSLYYDKGFVTVKVEEPEPSVDAAGGVSLSWKIDEGAAYSLGKVTFHGKHAEKLQKELSSLLKSRSKAVFNRSLLAADIEQIRAFFTRRGQSVEVIPNVEIDQKKKTINIVLEINEPS